MKKIYPVLLLALFILTGCRTPEFYQDAAVQKSREFLLKQCPQLTYEESSYIRFNKPVILHHNIVGGTGSLQSSRIKSDMNQIQIVWHVPKQDKFFIVWGVSSAAMQDFSPEKVFIRDFIARDEHRFTAVKRARAYIIGSLFSSLSVADYNDLRFREPEIFYSKIELEKSNMPKNGQSQFAFVWPLRSDPSKKIAAFGNGRKNLADFKPVSGTVFVEADLKSSLIAPYQSIRTSAAAKVADTPDAEKPVEQLESQNADAPADKTPAEPAAKPAAEKLPEIPKVDVIADIKAPLSEKSAPDTDIWGDNNTVPEQKIVDEIPEAPVLDTENDLKEPEK